MELKFNKSTDAEHQIQLESVLVSAVWRSSQAIGGQTASFEVRTGFVGREAPVKVKARSEKGKKLGKIKGKIRGGVYTGEFTIPEDIELDDRVYFEVELPKNGLSGESNRIPAIPPIEVTSMKWSSQEARRGDVLSLSADINGLRNGTEVVLLIYEYDADGCHDRITELPAAVADGKIEVQWEYEYHEDTDEIPTEAELQEYGKHYSPPEYFFTVKVEDVEYGKEQESGLLEFKDWLELELKDYQGVPCANEKYVVHRPDGSTVEGNLDDNGCARIEDVPPGPCDVEFPDLESD